MLIASVPIGMQFLLLLHLPTRCISGVFLFSRVIFNSFTSVSTVGHLLCYSHPSLCRMRAESGPDMYSLLTVNILCPKKRLLGTRRVLSHPCSRFPLISIPGSRKFLQIQILSDSFRFFLSIMQDFFTPKQLDEDVALLASIGSSRTHRNGSYSPTLFFLESVNSQHIPA